MPKLKNNQYELFAQGIFKGMSAKEAATKAGYSEKSATSKASQLLTIVNVRERIAELFKKAENAAIMSKQELAEMYTRMLGTKQSDFLTMSADGVWFHDIGPETIGQEALTKVKTRIITETHGRGEAQTISQKQFDEVELEKKTVIGQALSKLMGYDAATKLDVTGAFSVRFDDADKDL